MIPAYYFRMTYRDLPKEDDNMGIYTQEGHKHHLYRDDIEIAIKEKQIDRTCFHEFSKLGYDKILRKFCVSFCDIRNYPVSLKSFEINRMHFRPDLKQECIDCIFRTDSWSEYMSTIKSAIPDSDKNLFLILSDGWVYEGKIDEMFDVLNEIWYISDFYIVSSKFSWFIAVSHISDNAVMYSC